MTHVSRKQLDHPSDKLLDNALSALFSNLSANEVKSVLSALITKTEISMYKKRLAIILLLQEGATIDQIAKITKTTHQTVTRLKYQLAEVNKSHREFVIGKMKKRKNFQTIKSLIKDIANLPISRSEARKKLSKF